MNSILKNQRLLRTCFIRYSSTYKSISVGQPFTETHRVFLERDGKVISPFHDIPLYANEQKNVVNMVVEIPRWTNAKVEIATKEKFNPLKQDVKKGKPRFVRNCFPYKGYIWNYGALPQTWEDPSIVHPETKAGGDNDPIDVIEIGQDIAKRGEVKQVKVLGVLAMLDEGETDWKVLAIDTKDPMASKVNDVNDVEQFYPGLVDATRNWFKIYKVPDGKPENSFAFDGECKNSAYASLVIAETHEAWERLVQGKVPSKLDIHNTSVLDSANRIESESIVGETSSSSVKEEEAAGYDSKWYFV